MRAYPVVHHPIVRTTPDRSKARERLLHLPCRRHGRERGNHSSLPDLRASIMEYQYRVSWEPNQVTLWDNRIVQHYALSDHPDVRIMERASIVGDRPVNIRTD